jgi:ABC-type branched-subunit amino acid transport system permease subunit
LMVYGAVLIVVIIFMPDGILGGLKAVYHKYRTLRSRDK